LASGELPLIGGVLHRTEHWLVEHAVGPLEVGTMVVKPSRHVCHVAELSPEESHELGPLLQLTASVATDLCDPDQVYVCLWSHAGFQPVHLHFVVEPVTQAAVTELGLTGPRYQSHLFEQGTERAVPEVEAFCDRARGRFRR
jgi:diadenosine tetraphosphate (Ap4A) HIT family hydrolase